MNRLDDYFPSAAPLISARRENNPYSVWRSRGLRDYIVFYTFAGSCRIGYPGGEIMSQAGDVALIAPGVPHDYGIARGARRWGVTWVVFQARPYWMEWLQWPGPHPGIGHLTLSDDEIRSRVEQHLDDTQQLSSRPLANHALLAMNALEGALLWCWNATGSSTFDPRIRRALEFICREYHRPIGLDSMARAVGVSKPHFSRLFRDQLGTTPQRFLEDRRLERAGELLRATRMPVQEVASACGFPNPFYFSTRFRRRFRLTPRAYRGRELLSGSR